MILDSSSGLPHLPFLFHHISTPPNLAIDRQASIELMYAFILGMMGYVS